jgi:hypothetical protein
VRLRQEEWTWDKYHTLSMELSQDGLTIKKTNDSPDFSNAMGSEAFSSGYHTWEIKMNTVSRMWVGVASTENFEVRVLPLSRVTVGRSALRMWHSSRSRVLGCPACD